MNKITLLIFVLLFGSLINAQLWLPCPKPNSGHYEFSAGLHFWQDHLYIRNLQLRSLYYIYPGLRATGVFRLNDEINQIEYRDGSKPVYNKLNPIIDELYLEAMGFYTYGKSKLSSSLKIGDCRYLQFPYYGLIGRMDQVAGLADIRQSKQNASYSGALFYLDYNYNQTVGINNCLYFSELDNKFYSLNNYLFAMYQNDWFTAEARAGRLIVRDHSSDKVLTTSGWGYNIMAGIKLWGNDICLMWEEVDGVKYTGISIKFAPSIFSRNAGKVRLDYTRANEGFVFQYPIIYNDFGLLHREAIEELTKVGEIKAERAITFWRGGFQRNFYEHIISKWGETDTEVVIIKKEPMLLGIESIVSTVHSFSSINDFKKWDSNGIRPGQLTQIVIYEYYK